MFRYSKLIPFLFIIGCTSPPTQIDLPLVDECCPPSPIIEPNDTLLQTIEATLTIADQEIEEISRSKEQTLQQLFILQGTLNKEEQLILELQNQLNFKDSLANAQSLTLISLQKKLDSIETEFNQAKHKCTTECYPFIIQLNTTNKQLYSKVDSLNAEIGFLDSLIETNRKLSKQLGSY